MKSNKIKLTLSTIFLSFLLIFLSPPLTESYYSFPTKIDTLDERINIQVVLNTVLTPSPNLIVDGVLGRKSIQAIQSFQESHGLVPDGKVGPITRSALEQAQTGTTTSTPTTTNTTSTTNTSSNTTTSSTTGCIPGGLYNTNTGKPCTTTSSSNGCTSSTKYSPMTGVLCNQEETPTYCTGSAYRSCNISNGTGIQTRTCNNGSWSPYNTCTVSTCNPGYQKSGNSCVVISTTPITPVTCTGSSVQACNISNGTGTQSRTCTDGTWSSFNSCTVSTCNSGYEKSGNTCVVIPTTCTPESSSATCSGKCGTQTNNCGASVDCGNCPAEDAVILYYNNFEQNTVGSTSYKNDWGYCEKNLEAGIYQNISDSNASKVFRGSFPKGTYSLGDHGFRCYKFIEPNEDEVYLSYKIKFSPGFDPVKGGKLPSLEGGCLKWRCTSPEPDWYGQRPGICPSGYDFITTLIMFKNSGNGPVPVNYLYYPEQWNTEWYRDAYHSETGKYPNSCQDIIDEFGGCYGETTYWSKSFESGKWYTITQRVSLNTPGQSNGFVEGYIDGQRYSQITGMHFRDTYDIGNSAINFVSFFGGDTLDWSTHKDEYIYFDDVLLYTRPSSNGVLGGSTLPLISLPSSSILN